MEYLKDLYINKKEDFYKLLSDKVKVSLKLDGTSFQVYYNDETDKIEYHKISKDPKKIGPIIDNLSRLFIKSYNTAIDIINSHKDKISDYKILKFETFDDYIVLLSVVDKDNKIINNSKELEKISKELGCDYIPIIFDGQFSIDQQETISMIMKDSDSGDFRKIIKSLFEENENNIYKKYIDNIEGIVLDFYDKGKYKIIDPKSISAYKDKLNLKKETKDKFKDITDEVIKIIVNWMENNSEKIGSTKWDSLNNNFYELIYDSKIYNKLFQLVSQIPPSGYIIQKNRISEKLYKKIESGGMPLQILYELYMITFYSEKQKTYIISKEFQERINKIISKL